MPTLDGKNPERKTKEFLLIKETLGLGEELQPSINKKGVPKKVSHVAKLHYHPKILEKGVNKDHIVLVQELVKLGLWRKDYTEAHKIEGEEACVLVPQYPLEQAKVDYEETYIKQGNSDGALISARRNHEAISQNLTRNGVVAYPNQTGVAQNMMHRGMIYHPNPASMAPNMQSYGNFQPFAGNWSCPTIPYGQSFNMINPMAGIMGGGIFPMAHTMAGGMGGAYFNNTTQMVGVPSQQIPSVGGNQISHIVVYNNYGSGMAERGEPSNKRAMRETPEGREQEEKARKVLEELEKRSQEQEKSLQELEKTRKEREKLAEEKKVEEEKARKFREALERTEAEFLRKEEE